MSEFAHFGYTVAKVPHNIPATRQTITLCQIDLFPTIPCVHLSISERCVSPKTLRVNNFNAQYIDQMIPVNS